MISFLSFVITINLAVLNFSKSRPEISEDNSSVFVKCSFFISGSVFTIISLALLPIDSCLSMFGCKASSPIFSSSVIWLSSKVSSSTLSDTFSPELLSTAILPDSISLFALLVSLASSTSLISSVSSLPLSSA